MKLKLENGRLFPIEKGQPPVYMRRLSKAEIKLRKTKKDESLKPPAATAKPDERIRFFVYKATPKQVQEILNTQKDLLTIKRKFDNETVLFEAVYSGKVDLVKILLEAGANTKDLGFKKQNLLFEVVKSDRVNQEIFELLLQSGVDINGITETKETLLMAYCSNPFSQDVNFLKYLISKGLDVHTSDLFGNTALTQAFQKGWVKGAETLLGHGADLEPAKKSLSFLGRTGDLKTLKYLLKKGIIQDSRGKTALSLAARGYKKSAKVKKAFPEMLKIFKDYINTKDNRGETALFQCRDLESVKLLVEAGADKTITNKRGLSLLEHFKESKEIVKYLKK